MRPSFYRAYKASKERKQVPESVQAKRRAKIESRIGERITSIDYFFGMLHSDEHRSCYHAGWRRPVAIAFLQSMQFRLVANMIKCGLIYKYHTSKNNESNLSL